MTDGCETNPDVVGIKRLQDVSYDPFRLMPRELPPHPRMFVTPEHVARARHMVKTEDWAALALKRLLSACDDLSELPDALPVPADYELNGKVLKHASHNALAHLITDDERHRDAALSAFRALARAYPQWEINAGRGRGCNNSLGETRVTAALAQTYDMLAATGLDAEDERLFRQALEATRDTIDAQPHRACGNHNTWGIFGCLSAGVGLADPELIHDALYGHESDGRWRYGLVHQLRHDFLADGLHWERAPGYHFYTLMGFVEIAWLCANIGLDVWHLELPAQVSDDGFDLHRAYGPQGATRCLKTAFDAPFRLTFADGDLSLLHDSGLANLRAVHIWGPIYELAYQAYGDPKYAWLLNRIEREHPDREHTGLPMSLHASAGVKDFVRLDRVSYPEGHFSLAEDCDIAATGKHVGGCTLFPTTGQAILRSDPTDAAAPAAFMFWGPHSAGHQAPAALHVDLHAQCRRLTDAPRSGGYEDDMHLTWANTTIAHNTVTVDETSMFPCDQESDSIWEADRWRERPSDGVLETFEPQGDVKVLRASNESVYPGVRLDRTLFVTAQYVVDVFRALSDGEHRYDWAMHCVGEADAPPDAADVDLGARRGYVHFAEAKELTPIGGYVNLRWEADGGATLAQIVVPQDAQMVLARDPETAGKKTLGEAEECGPRTTVLVRARGGDVAFVSLWQCETVGVEAARLSGVEGEPHGDMILTVAESGGACRTLTATFQTGQTQGD